MAGRYIPYDPDCLAHLFRATRRWFVNRPTRRCAGVPGHDEAAIGNSAAIPNSDGAAVIRPGVRVLVIDDRDRVLLFASLGDDGRRFWFPPGGGVEPGESAEETARRELREETGLTTVALAGEVWRRRAVVTWGGITYDCRERWFLARVSAFAIDTSGFTAEERIAIENHGWWTLDELEDTADRLVPGNLASLLRDLFRDGLPEQPFIIEG
jgi:ADP-ribose pyrophosphatase YjhB (NUDIX family)